MNDSQTKKLESGMSDRYQQVDRTIIYQRSQQCQAYTHPTSMYDYHVTLSMRNGQREIGHIIWVAVQL